jgi:hypothetical protein
MKRFAWMPALALLGSCSSGLPGLGLEPGCQPLLAGQDCLLPYPSDFFLVADPKMPSGNRVEVTGAAKLWTDDGESADVDDFLATDGFSRQPLIVATLGKEVEPSNLTRIFDDKDQSTKDQSPTLILDGVTGERIAHFVDLDPRTEDLTRQAIVFHPLVQLKEKHPYVVVIRNLKDPQGQAIAPPEGFRRLRDGESQGDESLEAMAPAFENGVFEPLKKWRVERKSLQLAWRFTTGSDEWAKRDMLRMRELVRADLAARPPEVHIESVFEEEGADAWRVVYGTLTGPQVMEERAGPGTHLARDEDGHVRLNGRVSFEFRAVIPHSVASSGGAAVPIEYGHGFFGGLGEVSNGNVLEILEESGAIAFAVDWWGMASPDVGVVVSAAGEQGWKSLEFGERVHQGMANFLTLSAAIRGPFLAEPAFHHPVSTAPLYDAERLSWMGFSQGHILGGTIAALDPHLTRMVFGVGGAGYTHMMFRAAPFKLYLGLWGLMFEDRLDHQKFAATLQRQFDRFEPATYASHILDHPLDSAAGSAFEDRQVLMHVGIGDAQVPNFTSYFHARQLEIPLVVPGPREVWGLGTTELPTEGSALVIFDVGVDDAFSAEALPPANNPAHEAVRRLPEARAQIATFLQTGVIADTCEGSCEPR